MIGRATTYGYDETEIAVRLAALSSSARALFACACAERLMPVCRWFYDMTDSMNYVLVREALNAAWSADILHMPVEVAQIAATIPCDNAGGPFPGSAIARNAIVCVAYAMEARQHDELQASVWAARQLYDAADVVVQQGSPTQEYVENIDLEAPVQLMLRGIYTTLDNVVQASRANLLANAQHDGEMFLSYVNGNA
jgi:hypothetical protein